jgi:hypothetical protein
MWICPNCERNFKSTNQSHICTTKTIDDIFGGRPDRLVLAFDAILIGVIDWEPCSVGTSTKSIVFTKEKAWLIIRPMSKELDIKFYYPEKIEHRLIKKTTHYGNKVAHHIRISDETEVTDELLELLQKGFAAS